MQIGRYEVSAPNLGMFRLDGGAMFGSVPKNLWSRRIPADGENCIPLATRSLLIRGSARCMLVDVGCGEKWDEKSRRIFAIRNTPPAELGFERGEVTDVILTHLHFDHAGGISYYDGTDLKLTYPNARVFLQRANWENAHHPSPKERASYLSENIRVLEGAKLELIDGSNEIAPGIRGHRVDGHTLGQQWIEVSDGGAAVFFPTDLVPTSHHLSVPFHMGYDICAGTVMREKEEFGALAMEKNAVVVFQHDPVVEAARVTRDERGQFTSAGVLTL